MEAGRQCLCYTVQRSFVTAFFPAGSNPQQNFRTTSLLSYHRSFSGTSLTVDLWRDSWFSAVILSTSMRMSFKGGLFKFSEVNSNSVVKSCN